MAWALRWKVWGKRDGWWILRLSGCWGEDSDHTLRGRGIPQVCRALYCFSSRPRQKPSCYNPSDLNLSQRVLRDGVRRGRSVPGVARPDALLMHPSDYRRDYAAYRSAVERALYEYRVGLSSRVELRAAEERYAELWTRDAFEELRRAHEETSETFETERAGLR